MKQAFNPFLPFDNCIPDGEPHVFGDRIYLYGSHDKPCGETFCELDYEVWSAPVNDLTDWSSHGTVYSAKQDPLYSEDKKYLFAPDCVRGNDGRYYLYYALAGWRGKGGYDGPISVAVSDRPEGPFEYYGCVHHADGTPFNDKVLFDPAVINDDGTIRLYFGTSYFLDEGLKFPTRSLYAFIEGKIFNRPAKSLKNGDKTGAWHIRLADDMKRAFARCTQSHEWNAFWGTRLFRGSVYQKIQRAVLFHLFLAEESRAVLRNEQIS